MIETVAAAPRNPGWMRALILIGAVLGIGAPLVAIIMGLLTGAGVIGWQISLFALKPLSWVAMAGGLLSLIAMLLLALRRRWRALVLPMIAVVIAMGFVAMLSYNFGKAALVPPIHDITTDLVDPPAFRTLSLRAGDLAEVPDGGDPQLGAMAPEQRWRFYLLRDYPDIRPIMVPTNVPDTVEAARNLIAERGWDLAAADAASGHLEATDTVSIYQFKDDVVLRITPNPDGPGSIVDMRSVSRVGVSDLGVNAERVRAFLADLKARLS